MGPCVCYLAVCDYLKLCYSRTSFGCGNNLIDYFFWFSNILALTSTQEGLVHELILDSEVFEQKQPNIQDGGPIGGNILIVMKHDFTKPRPFFIRAKSCFCGKDMNTRRLATVFAYNCYLFVFLPTVRTHLSWNCTKTNMHTHKMKQVL